jgi:hypothetical protein
MLVAAPPGLLNVLFGHHGTAGAMEPRAVDQTGLKGLELFTRNNMVVNVDNHLRSFLEELNRSYKGADQSVKPVDKTEPELEYWSGGSDGVMGKCIFNTL